MDACTNVGNEDEINVGHESLDFRQRVTGGGEGQTCGFECGGGEEVRHAHFPPKKSPRCQEIQQQALALGSLGWLLFLALSHGAISRTSIPVLAAACWFGSIDWIYTSMEEKQTQICWPGLKTAKCVLPALTRFLSSRTWRLPLGDAWMSAARRSASRICSVVSIPLSSGVV